MSIPDFFSNLLVAYFVRRIYRLLHPGGFTAFITTNSIKDGDIRKDGLEQVLKGGGTINMAVRGIKWPGRANLVVSLVALHHGEWHGKRMLDGKEVPVISAFFDDSDDAAEPSSIAENTNMVFEGVKLMGDGFLLSNEDAERLLESEPLNHEIIFPVINGEELNNHPVQRPGRSVINFFDWPVEKARNYETAFEQVLKLVKPVRDLDNRPLYREKWWLFGEARRKLTFRLKNMARCFAASATTKYLNFSNVPADTVFHQTVKVFTTERWDLYAVVQSTLHEVWARKYSGALETRLRYSPSDCFETFPFPEGLWQTPSPALADLGEHYHEHRRALMRRLWLGLTDIYNLFHTRDLTPAQVAKVSKKPLDEAEAGYEDILQLRRLHRRLDEAIRDAYGWSDLDLGHGFHEIETLPENDRVRYSLSPGARKEVLKRLLAENHRRAALETAAAALAEPVKKKRAKKAKVTGAVADLFDGEEVVETRSATNATPGTIDLSRLPDRAWERPGTDQKIDATLILAALLKAVGRPTPRRDFRLAALLALRPRLLLDSLSAADAAQWKRLVGDEAEPLAHGVTALQPPADRAWGGAVRELLARDSMVEDLDAQTWAPGEGLEIYLTEDHWPEGRARMVLRVLSQRGAADEVATRLPKELWEWVNDRAA